MHGIHGFEDLHDGAGALHAAAVQGDLFGGLHGLFLLFLRFCRACALLRRRLGGGENGLIEADAAGVDADVFKAVLRQDARGVVGPHADAAEDDVFLIPIQLAQPVAQLTQGDLHRVGHAVGHGLGLFAHVQAHGLGPGPGRVPFRNLHKAGQDVLRHVARHVDRVLGRGIGRSVGQLQVLEVVHRAAEAHGHAQGVDALVHPFPANDLRAEDPAGVRREKQLDGHGRRAGIVAGVGVLHDGQALVVPSPDHAALFEGLLIRAGGGGRQVEHLGHRRALGALVAVLAPGEDVRQDPALLVGGSRQRDHGAALEDEVLDLDHVAHGVDAGVVGPQVIVHDDAAAPVELQARVLRQLAVGPHADGEDDQVGRDLRAALQLHGDGFPVVGKARHRVGQMEGHAVVPDVLVQQLGKLKVDGRHDLVEGLDDRDLEPGVTQVFGHLQADEAAADHRGGPDVFALHQLPDLVGVGHGPEGADARAVDAGDAGTQRRGAGGDHELVIAFLIFFAGLQLLHGDGLVFTIDGRDLVLYAHVDAETLPHALRGHEQQGAAAADHVAHMVRQAAVCVGNVPASFQDNDLSVRVESAKPRSAAGAAGHAADDDGLFHGYPSFVSILHEPPQNCKGVLAAARRKDPLRGQGPNLGGHSPKKQLLFHRSSAIIYWSSGRPPPADAAGSARV